MYVYINVYVCAYVHAVRVRMSVYVCLSHKLMKRFIKYNNSRH